jgi:uncharacterized protein YnzC (UPF0291/DUF896 family)
MTTISFKDFSKGGVVQTLGNEATVQQQEQSSGQPSFFQKLKDTASQTVSNVKDIANSDSSLPSKALQVTGAVAQGGLNAVGDVVSSTPIVKDVVKAASEPISAGIKATQDWIANNPSVQKAVTNETSNAIASFLDQHPDIAKNAKAVNSIANAILVAKGAVETAGTAKNLATKAVDSVPNIVAPVVDTAKAVAQKITPESTAIMQRVARIPKGEQVKFENLAGESVGSYLDRTGNYGTTDQIVEKLYKDFTQSKANADNALETLKGTYRAAPMRTALNELEGKMQRTSSPGAPDPELSRVTELANKEKTTGLTMSEINEVKRIFERRVRLDYMKEGTSQDSIQRATNIDKAVHDWQMAEADKAGLTNLQEINKATQINKQLMDALGKENSGSAGNNALGLTDAILVAGGSPQAIASLLVKKTFSDKGVQSFVAKKLSKNKVKATVPEAKFKEKLQLPAPKEGSPNVSNEVPIKMNKESASTISKREVTNNSKSNTYNATELSSKLKNSLLSDSTGKYGKPDRFIGEQYSIKEAKTGIAENGKNIKGRIVIGKDGKGNLIVKDGTHLLEAYRILKKDIPKDKISFENGVTSKDLSTSKK